MDELLKIIVPLVLKHRPIFMAKNIKSVVTFSNKVTSTCHELSI